MFSKKNKDTARKAVVNHDNQPEREVKINIQVKPLVEIKEEVLLVNGKPSKKEYAIAIGGRDIVRVSAREYNELFMEMLRHKEAGELIHDISEVHAEEHCHAENEIEGLVEAIEKSGLGKIFGELKQR